MKTEVALRKFEEYLKTKNLRATKQRLEILQRAWDGHHHFTAEQMLMWARQNEPEVSRATVYRTLSLMVEGGFLGALDRGKSKTLYEHILGHSHHDHMVCATCGKIIEFRCEAIEALQELEAKRHNFHTTSHNLTLTGQCGGCCRGKDS